MDILAIMTILGGIAAIWFFWDVIVSRLFKRVQYAHTYRIRDPNRGKEKYIVLEKIEFRKKSGCDDSARILLVKSSKPNAMGFMDISIGDDYNELMLDRYAFIHSFNHNWIAPGKIFIKNTESWLEKTPSNDFKQIELKSEVLHKFNRTDLPEKFIMGEDTIYAVRTTFNYPQTYTGPRYKNRMIVFVKGIGLIYSKTEYINGKIDKYKLSKYKVSGKDKSWFPVKNIGNWWVYDIEFENGANKINMNS